jgi:hypothetical protein
MPERDIRAELKKRVEAYGGEVRAVSWLGRKHAPDVLCLFPANSKYASFHRLSFDAGHSLHPFVETKAPGGEPNEGQEREHVRMRSAGCNVYVISTWKQLDEWLPELP